MRISPERLTPEAITGFHDYFNVADEIFESLEAGADQTKRATSGPVYLDFHCTLADLDERAIRSARTAAGLLDLPFPPYLPAAEEALNMNEALR